VVRSGCARSRRSGVGHAKRLEHPAPDHFGDRRALDPRDDLAHQGEAQVGVAPLGAWRHVEGEAVGEEAEHVVVRLVRPEGFLHALHIGGGRRLADAGGVGEQMAQRHRRGVAVDDEFRDVVHQPVAEAEAAFVHQRHDAEPDHGLGDRADALAKAGMLRSPALDVREAEAFGEH
jgi:hypothetical protein